MKLSDSERDRLMSLLMRIKKSPGGVRLSRQEAADVGRLITHQVVRE